MVKAPASLPPEGLPLKPAIERVVQSDLWDTWINAFAEYDWYVQQRLQVRRERSPPPGAEFGKHERQARVLAEAAWNAVWRAFCQSWLNGELEAEGRRGDHLSPLTSIPLDAVPYLRVVDLDASTLVGPGNQRIVNVRFRLRALTAAPRESDAGPPTSVGPDTRGRPPAIPPEKEAEVMASICPQYQQWLAAHPKGRRPKRHDRVTKMQSLLTAEGYDVGINTAEKMMTKCHGKSFP